MVEYRNFRKDITVLDSNGGIPLRTGFSFCNGGWEPITLPKKYDLDNGHLGADDGLTFREGGCPISTPDAIGKRGEAIYTLKTVYTDITVDGERDPAYDYGVHLSGALPSAPEYYKNRSTNIEIYMIRGQDGKLYVYGEVTDPDIVIEDEVIARKPHWCDGLHCYIDMENAGFAVYPIGLILGSEKPHHTRYAPRGCVTKRTEKGFKFEYSYIHHGNPYINDDILGFAFYYNDTNEYVDASTFKRTYVKLPSKLNPAGTEFRDPGFITHDALLFSHEPASGRFSISSGSNSTVTGDALTDILSGAASVSVVYPELCSAHAIIAAKEINTVLRICGANSGVFTENEAPSSDYVILVEGNTHPQSIKLNKIVKYNGYALSFDGRTIALAGKLEDALYTAKDLFFSALDYVRRGGKTSDLGSLYFGAIEEIENAPEMDQLSLVTDAGDGSYLLLARNASPSAFDAYADKLVAAGYKLYTENRMSSVRCATYTSERAVINLTYGENEDDRSLRAVVDIPAMTALPPLKKEEYSPVCDSYIIQLKPTSVYFMTYVIKLDNGEYFIIDAGGNGAEKYIFDSLMKLSGGEKVTVACWLFTHFHCDHIGGFINLMDNDEHRKKIKVKTIINNFPQWQVLDTSSDFDHTNLYRWQGIVDKSGATVYQARTGQKFYFGNAELEMLFTYEDLMPFCVITDRTNPTSHIFSVKINGQRLIMTGDACGEATALLVKRMGSDLKADFVQLPHHGFGDGGTCLDFYKLIDAPWVLYPGTGHNPNASEAWALKNSRAYFLNLDRDSVIPLPYNGEEV